MTSSNTRNLFIALHVPDPIKEELATEVEWLGRNFPDGVAWFRSDMFHMTVKYLGPTPEGRMSDVIQGMTDVAGKCWGNFAASCQGLGRFQPVRQTPHPVGQARVRPRY